MVSEIERDDAPLRLCAPEVFARARRVLRECGMTWEDFRESLKLGEESDLSAIDADDIDWASMPEARRLLLRTLVFGELAPRMEFERVLDPEALGALFALGIVREAPCDALSLYSPVFVYPVGDLIIASDRHSNADGSAFVPPPDIVFPAINISTLLSLKVLPRAAAASDALDLCGGTGVAALALSRCARRVVTSDLTPRASHFARFNRLLNDCLNVEVVEGDLYEPVADRSFDLIVTHPPFAPALGGALIYRDGGATGESLVRRIIEGLPEHLRAGGTFYCVSQVRDTKEGPFEERARSWLGEAAREFDIIFTVGEDKSVKEFISEVAYRKLGEDSAEVRRMAQCIEEAGTTGFVYGVFVARRHRAPAPPWTMRTRLSENVCGDIFEGAFRWHDFTLRADFRDRLALLKPRLAPRLYAHVSHTVRDGALTPFEFLLETDAPFHVRARTDPWVVTLITSFDGEATCAELYAAANAARVVPEAFVIEDFLNLVALLVERGFVTIDDAELRAAEEA